LDTEGIGEADFEHVIQETFVINDSSQKTVELQQDGASIPVTYQNAGQYADLVESYLLNESTEIYQTIRKGMSAVCPLNLLYLFSWR
jgi:hypothetical protein